MAKLGNRPARSHRNPKILILTKFDHSKLIKTPKDNLTPVLGPLCKAEFLTWFYYYMVWFLFRSNIIWPFVLQFSSSPFDFVSLFVGALHVEVGYW